MGKNSKPDKDFKKRKAKLGKRVKKANATDTSFKSKQIYMPEQRSLDGAAGEGFDEALRRLLAAFGHSTASAKVKALESVKALLEANTQLINSNLGLVLPAALELLLDEDKDVRNSLASLFSYAVSFGRGLLPSLDICVVYLCSGLTCLEKVIRRDALSLTKTLCERCQVIPDALLCKLLNVVVDLVRDSVLRNMALETIHAILRHHITAQEHTASIAGNGSAEGGSSHGGSSSMFFTPRKRRLLQVVASSAGAASNTTVDARDEEMMHAALAMLATSLHNLMHGLLSTTAEANGFGSMKDINELQGYLTAMYDTVQWVAARRSGHTELLSKLLALAAMASNYFPFTLSERIMDNGELQNAIAVANLTLAEAVLAFISAATGLADLQQLSGPDLANIVQYVIDSTERYVDAVTSEAEGVERPAWGGRLFRCISLLVSENVAEQLQSMPGGFDATKLIEALSAIVALPFECAVRERSVQQRHLAIFPQAMAFLNRTIVDCTETSVDQKELEQQWPFQRVEYLWQLVARLPAYLSVWATASSDVPHELVETTLIALLRVVSRTTIPDAGLQQIWQRAGLTLFGLPLNFVDPGVAIADNYSVKPAHQHQQQSVYASSPASVQNLMLDLLFYTPFDEETLPFGRAVQLICAVVASAQDSGVRGHFLQLAVHRRQEMTVPVFMNFIYRWLFEASKAAVASTATNGSGADSAVKGKKRGREEQAAPGGKAASGARLLADVAEQAGQIASTCVNAVNAIKSAERPLKFVRLLHQQLKLLLQAKGPDKDVHALVYCVATSRLLNSPLYRELAHSDRLLTLLQRRASDKENSKTPAGEEDAEQQLVVDILSNVADFAAHLTTLPTDSSDFVEQPLRPLLTRILVRLLISPVTAAAEEEDGSSSEQPATSYPLFLAFANRLFERWNGVGDTGMTTEQVALSAEALLHLFRDSRTIPAIYSHQSFIQQKLTDFTAPDQAIQQAIGLLLNECSARP